MLWFRANSSIVFTFLDVRLIFILSSTMGWYLEVRIPAKDWQYSFCLLIPETKIIKILKRLTWMFATVAVSSLVFPDLYPFLRPCQNWDILFMSTWPGLSVWTPSLVRQRPARSLAWCGNAQQGWDWLTDSWPVRTFSTPWEFKQSCLLSKRVHG